MEKTRWVPIAVVIIIGAILGGLILMADKTDPHSLLDNEVSPTGEERDNFFLKN